MHTWTITAPGHDDVTSITVASGALARLPELVANGERVLLVADAALEGSGVVRSVAARVDAQPCLIGGGEPAKTLATVERLWNAWLDEGAGRDSVVVALGGGSISDVAGFAAACYLRGVSWIALPTTVLAMADAAVGGKTGVNLAAGKNLAGAVHAPRAVLADIDLLGTLPDDAFADGWAEVVKAGVIGDADLLGDCERRAPEIRRREPEATRDLLIAALRVKCAVVEADPREGSRREILNFGHTVAHALERALPGLSHGRAVAVGMEVEAHLAEARALLPAGTAQRLREACRALGIRTGLAEKAPEGALVAALGVDKKRRGGRLRVALPSSLGVHGAEPGVEVSVEELLAALGRASGA